jgi:hypothetical protein
MSEGDPGPVDAGGGGGSFWTSLPTILTASAVFIGAVTTAVVQLRGDGGDDEATRTAATTQTTSTPGLSHFVAMTRPGGRNYFEGDTMFVKASVPARPVLVLAEGDKPLQDVRMRAHAEWVSGAKDYGIGFVCRYENVDSYYLLSVLSGGRYHIVRYRRGKPVSLTGGIQTNGLIEDGANDVDVKCIGSDPTLLTLIVDGREIETVRDEDGIAAGNVGLRVGTSESVVTCSFRDFTLSSL